MFARFLKSEFFVVSLLMVFAPATESSALSYVPASLKAPPVEQEFRAAWIATVHNIDWPSKRGLPVAQQKSELIAILDKVKAMRMNAVVLQVRPSCDALYSSSIEPWSPWLTGAMGRSPGYDPLAFAVAECHARGLELHAWFNPFRALASTSLKASSSHITKTQPSWVRRYEGKVWLDPGLPAVRKHALKVIADVVARYDVDGVHIDDYFYPYPKDPSKRPVPQFPDSSTHKRYGRGKGRDEWRRANIVGFVESMYRTVKAKKPWVKVGVSPFGIWRPGVPSGVEAGLDAYNMLYADSRTWLREGWVDYLSPQLYWPIAGPQSYSRLLSWWDSQNKEGRHIWPGVASDRIGPKRAASEIGKQVSMARSPRRPSSSGHIHWSVSALMDNKRGVSDMLVGSHYSNAAAVPPIRWISGKVPGRPKLRARVEGDQLFVDWEAGSGSETARYVVQTRVGGKWQAANLVSAGRKGMRWRIGKGGSPDAIAATPVDRYGNLGSAAVLRRR